MEYSNIIWKWGEVVSLALNMYDMMFYTLVLLLGKIKINLLAMSYEKCYMTFFMKSACWKVPNEKCQMERYFIGNFPLGTLIRHFSAGTFIGHISSATFHWSLFIKPFLWGTFLWALFIAHFLLCTFNQALFIGNFSVGTVIEPFYQRFVNAYFQSIVPLGQCCL